MRNNFRLICGVAGAILLVLVCNSAPAQEKPAPPRHSVRMSSDSSSEQKPGQLPKIDLPEFVVTGNDAPSVAAASKDSTRGASLPLLSGGSEVRDAFDAHAGDAGRTITARPVPPGVQGRVIAGYGSYVSPFLDGWVGRVEHDFSVALSIGYRSSAGYQANTDYRRAYGNLSGTVALAGTHDAPDEAPVARVGVGLKGASYALYGSRTPGRSRSVDRFSSSLDFRGISVGGVRMNAAFSLGSTALTDSIATRETTLGFGLSGETDYDNMRLRAGVDFWPGAYRAPTALATPLGGQAWIRIRVHIVENIDLDGGLLYCAARSSSDVTTGWMAPLLSVSWSVHPRATLFVRFEPGLHRTTLDEIVAANPYVRNDVRLRHQEHLTMLSAGIQGSISDRTRGTVALVYERVRGYPVFTDQQAEGLWEVMPDAIARIITLKADCRAEVSARGALSGSVAVRGSSLSATGVAVPFLPASEARLAYDHRLPFGLSAEGTLRFVGPRYSDLAATARLDGFVTMDAAIDYNVTTAVRLRFSIENLFDQKQVWWTGYRGLPFTASLAAAYTW